MLFLTRFLRAIRHSVYYLAIFTCLSSLINTAAAQRPNEYIDLQYFLPVTLTPGAAQTYNLWTELRSANPTQGKTLLITVSGVTFDHRYWDAPSGPSFVDEAVRSGFSVLNIESTG